MNSIRNIKEVAIKNITADNILVIFFFSVGVIGFVRSFSFSPDTARLPQFSSGLMLISCILLITRNYIFSKLRIQNRAKKPVDKQVPDNDLEAKLEHKTEADIDKKSVVIVVCSTIGYIILAYLIGFLWSSTVFASSYIIWRKRPWHHVMIIGFVVYSIVYLFMTLTNQPLNDGVLINLIMNRYSGYI